MHYNVEALKKEVETHETDLIGLGTYLVHENAEVIEALKDAVKENNPVVLPELMEMMKVSVKNSHTDLPRAMLAEQKQTILRSIGQITGQDKHNTIQLLRSELTVEQLQPRSESIGILPNEISQIIQELRLDVKQLTLNSILLKARHKDPDYVDEHIAELAHEEMEAEQVLGTHLDSLL